MAVKDATGSIDFSELGVRLEQRLQPLADKRAQIVNAYTRWFEREQRREGAVLTSSPPEAVDEAIAKVDRQRVVAARKFFDEAGPVLARELAEHIGRVDGQFEALVSSMDALRHFQQEYSRLAAACSSDVPAALADANISNFALTDWRRKAAYALNPPIPRRVEHETENRLVLD